MHEERGRQRRLGNVNNMEEDERMRATGADHGGDDVIETIGPVKCRF